MGVTLVVFVFNQAANRIENLVDGLHCIGIVFGSDQFAVTADTNVELYGKFAYALMSDLGDGGLAFSQGIVESLQGFKAFGDVSFGCRGTIDTMENDLQHMNLSFLLLSRSLFLSGQKIVP
jgi:hypothetical protein